MSQYSVTELCMSTKKTQKNNKTRTIKVSEMTRAQALQECKSREGLLENVNVSNLASVHRSISLSVFVLRQRLPNFAQFCVF